MDALSDSHEEHMQTVNGLRKELGESRRQRSESIERLKQVCEKALVDTPSKPFRVPVRFSNGGVATPPPRPAAEQPSLSDSDESLDPPTVRLKRRVKSDRAELSTKNAEARAAADQFKQKAVEIKTGVFARGENPSGLSGADIDEILGAD
jgi:hypothetical protein